MVKFFLSLALFVAIFVPVRMLLRAIYDKWISRK